MSFSINTNIASLQAQHYLRGTSEFQQKTISRVTSGLRIVSSGDDAAGLAIANGYRSDLSVLTQGVRNANDGLSQLQIVDGGMNNISMLLDRARTLATQSASGTFTGSRSVLNSEFSTVISEIDRQAQSIGLNTGGDFAKSLAVFIGGGKTSNGISAISNGSVSVDLTQSTVDAKSLGLKGVQSVGSSGTDIGTGSASTSVAQILANTTNTNSEAVTGYTDFYFAGPGFGDNGKVKVSVNLTGVTDTDTLVTAVNTAIANAGNGGTQAATAFKNANVTASINTDADGKKQLAFNSSNAAFQVEAGDRVANALLGNFSAGSTGKDMAVTVAGATTTATALANSVIVRLQGASIASPVDITLAAGTAQSAIDSLYSQVSQSAALQAAGISVNQPTAASGAVTFTSNRGQTFDVQVVGDTRNTLGLGTWYASGGNFEYTSITSADAITTGGTETDVLEFSIAGGPVQQVSVTLLAADTEAQIVDKINTAILANATLKAAGLTASLSGGTDLKLDSANGTAFRVRQAGGLAANQVLGFVTGNATDAALGASASALSGTTTIGDNTNVQHYNAGGSYATSAFNFTSIKNGQDAQTITLNANDATGAAHSASIVLQNNATARNARSIDEAIAAINDELQQSNDTTLQKIVAVKDYDGTNHVDTIRFLSAGDFSVTLGQAGTGGAVGIGTALQQGAVQDASALAGGGTADISTQSSAQAAVTALATSITILGDAQAVVGRGQNQFGYAVNLAQSQLSNLAAAESRIRDADLASEAANMTKAQILLQAGIAALAQANSAPQQVLSLLRG